MKKQLERMIQVALRHLLDQQELVAMPAFIQIEATKEEEFGDFATNIALILARTTHHAPYSIAERIVSMMAPSPLIEKIEIREPGFINFFLAPAAYQGLLTAILSEKAQYGCCKIGRAKKVLVEFVSASPVKPLSEHHARLAVFGQTIAKLLSMVGFQVATEFFVDNIGLAATIFVIEVWQAYLANLDGVKITDSGYGTPFARIVATLLQQSVDREFYQPNIELTRLSSQSHSAEEVVAYAHAMLGDHFQLLEERVTALVVAMHKADLALLGITFDYWTEAKSLLDRHLLDNVLNRLAEKGVLYQHEGGSWFRAGQFGDERDRVLVRPNGEYTHLAYDLAYHLNKFERGFDLAVDIFDFNPVDYATGIQAGIQALGYDPEQIMPYYVQPAHVMRYSEQLNVPLSHLLTIYTKDALYFQLLMKRACQPIELALDAQSLHDHPLSHIQHAITRVQKIFNELHKRGLPYQEEEGLQAVNQLTLPEERILLNMLASYSEMLVHAALQYEPHLIAYYLRTLAALFHAYYHACLFLIEDVALRSARLTLINAVKQLLMNGCALLGISLSDTM